MTTPIYRTLCKILISKCFFIKTLLLINPFFCSLSLYSQQTKAFVIPDSLQNKTYKELATSIVKDKENIGIATLYASCYVTKAKKEGDIEKIAKGFHYLAYLNTDEVKIKYFDSIIEYTKAGNLKGFTLRTYLMKSQYYYDKRDFKKALDNCIKVNSYIDKTDDNNLIIENNFKIGLIKTRLGYYNEALAIFKQCSDDYLKISDNHKNYLSSVYAIADTFRHLKELDSASFYNEKGLKIALSKDSKQWYNYFLLNEGANQYDKNNYKKALDYIQRSLPYIKEIPDKSNEAMGYHFLGKIYSQLDDKSQSEIYLKKVDTIYQKIKDLHPELRIGYEILINNYREKGDKEQQLVYIKKLLQIDSLLKSNYQYLSRKLNKEYDTPKLINERDTIINQLKSKNKYWALSLFIILLVFGIIFYINYKKQKTIREKFNRYIQAQNIQPKPDSSENDQLSISKDIQDHIMESLKQFEISQGYLDNTISLNSLAKQLQTNTNYLSKMVNFYKKKSFGSYINDLRLEYTIDRLKTEKMFRKYSIKAISEEVGFNNPESFSKAFYKKTEIKPSSFIKQLEKIN
ncbi:helix-turn-helix domain-containing protein [Aquimarina sp. LLG6339-5]|uniref:helix-turn-helix domain-containing protein n=1 Tax=Aquimarina sp. LLG6339-5 TaxID=3160830 RepID=UPI003870961D